MSEQNMLIHLVAGGLAGTTGAMITCPLEVVKTRYQASQQQHQHQHHHQQHQAFPRGTQTASLHTSNKHKPKPKHQLTAAFSSSINRVSSSNPLLLKTNMHWTQSGSGVGGGGGSGGGGGGGSFLSSAGRFANTNLELSTNSHSHLTMQNHQRYAYAPAVSAYSSQRGILSSLKSIVANEGYSALFKGLGPNLIGVAPYRAIYFFSYANAKSLLATAPLLVSADERVHETPALHICSAFLAGFTAVTITNPIWFVKTRMQLDESRHAKSSLEVVAKLWSERGLLGFYKGISASYFGVAESALYFVIYERLKRMARDSADAKATSSGGVVAAGFPLLTYLTSAGSAKSLASCICYPHEVARTRLRLEGNKYNSFFQTLALVLREEGVRGLYKGMATHLIRQIPNTAIVMTTYELIVANYDTLFGKASRNNNNNDTESDSIKRTYR